MIKKSTAFLYLIDIAVFASLGFLKLLPLQIGGNLIRVLVLIYGVLLNVLLIPQKKNSYYCAAVKKCKKFLVFYIACVIYALLIAAFNYQYSLWDATLAVSPFLYVIYVFPLIYVASYNGNVISLIGHFSKIELVMLFIKALSWAIYNFTSSKLLNGVALSYGVWVRNGMQRVEQGSLFYLCFAYYLFRFISDKRTRIKNTFVLLFISLFAYFVVQYRFLVICMGLTFIVVIFFQKIENTHQVFFRRFMIVLLVGVVLGFTVTSILESFSVNGALGGSTGARLFNIETYYKLMRSRKAWLGFGLLDSFNENAHSFMTNEGYYNYLDDIGILGGIVRFGLLSIVVYGGLFYQAIKAAIYRYENAQVRILVLSVVTMMLSSCILLNIFDHQRGFAVPFYLFLIFFPRVFEDIDKNRNERSVNTKIFY